MQIKVHGYLVNIPFSSHTTPPHPTPTPTPHPLHPQNGLKLNYCVIVLQIPLTPSGQMLEYSLYTFILEFFSVSTYIVPVRDFPLSINL